MKRTFLLFVLLLINLIIFAQGPIKKQRTVNDKIFFGGGLGLQFGSYTGIEIAPVIGYKPIENLYTGLRLSYQYYGGSGVDFHIHVGSGSLFGQYIFLNKLIVHAEFEEAYVNYSYETLNNYNDDYWYFNPLVGGGLYQKLGDRSGVMLLILYNLNDSDKAIYNNPIFRFNFIF